MLSLSLFVHGANENVQKAHEWNMSKINTKHME